MHGMTRVKAMFGLDILKGEMVLENVTAVDKTLGVCGNSTEFLQTTLEVGDGLGEVGNGHLETSTGSVLDGDC